ncbi:Component of the BRCA1-A complex [Dissophora ornata]|nr:Component of the BRCA1-A complex [Dissophora ornata]
MESPAILQSEKFIVDDMEQGSPIPKVQREKIIFCIDLDTSMDECFAGGEKANDTRINRTKQLLKWFIEQKSKWNPNHEFALMILGEKAVWHMDFTSDTVLLSHAIGELFTMGTFTAFENADIEEDDGSVVRALMIYTRSDVLPTEPDPDVLDALYASRRFFYDCIYIHHKASEVSGPVKPQHVYDRLTEMEDVHSPGYYYELTRVLKKFSTAMGELLAHPRVRSIQDAATSRMGAPPSVRRMEMELQQKHQQEQLQQTQSVPKRSDIPVRYKSPDMTTPLSPENASFFGGPASSPSPSVPIPRHPPSAPLASHPTSPYASPKERVNSSRIKVERSQTGPPSGAGSGAGTVSGSGTGKDDAILI